MGEEFDYVVVGAGAAGCVVAARLAENPGCTVALIEAGGSDRHPWVPIPIGYARLMNDPKLNWGFATEAEPGLGNRRVNWPRGKLLGGSGSINGLVFLRGAPGDFDHWRDLSAAGWSYAEVLPYFRKLERCLVPGLDEAFHGYDGAIPVSAIAAPSRVARAFVESCEQLGYARNHDFNGRALEGAGFLFLNTERGRRRTTAMTYLRPALSRGAGIRLMNRTLARRILFEGRSAVGVEVRTSTGEIRQIRCRRDIVLAAGAVNSPQLLLLSGIGDAGVLSGLGIEPLHHLPGVGEGLQDHAMARFAFRCTAPITLNDVVRNPFRLARMGLDYLVNRSGPMAISAAEASLFVDVDTGQRETGPKPGPDLQFQVANFSLDSYATGLHPFSGFVYSICVCRPESRGRVSLSTAAPEAKPRIVANYLTAEYDCRAMIAGFRIGRALSKTQPLAGLIAEEIKPGVEVDRDEDLLAYIRQHATTTFHPCGTCRMGTDASATVDPQLRVHGISGLRVIDASVMPTIPSTNIHAATIMIAEKGADLLRGGTLS